MTIYPSGSMINNRYEVVQGPHEKPSLAGGMGLVYLCVDHGENGRPVALKTFRPEYLPNREARDRFLREGSTWMELGYHPHIVRCHQVFKVDVGSEVFFVLDLVAAAEDKHDASLRAWLTPGRPLPVEQALLFALHIARGMKHATGKIPGLVHRDLKPENVLVGRDGFARVTDFGLAGILSNLSEAIPEQVQADPSLAQRRLLTFTKGFVGTPEYASPEQFDGKELDERSDIYAFGCILFEMLTGQPPFIQKYKTPEERLLKYQQCHKSEEPKPPSSIIPTLTGKLETIVTRCLRKRPDERYTSWGEVETVLASAYRVVAGKEALSEITTEGETRAELVTLGWSYNAMGGSYSDIGKFSVAREYFAKVLAIGRQEGERSLQAAGLGNLGYVYRQLGDVRSAIGYFEQHLAIARETGDRQSEGVALGNLGNAYRQLGDAHRAIGYFEQHLIIVREIGDRQGEGQALGNLGIAYRQLGDIHRAIKYCEQDLAIAREIGDRQGEGQAMDNLGIAYRQLGDAQGAIGYHEQHLAIAREIGDRQGESLALGGLGSAYFQLGDAQGAIGYHEQHLAIAREIDDRQGEGKALGNLGNAYLQLGDVHDAIGYYEQCLAISREIGDRQGEGQAMGSLGIAYRQLNDVRRAIEYYKKYLAISREIGDRQSEGTVLGNLGNVFAQLGDVHEAINHYKRSLTILREIGDVINEASFSLNLAILYSQQGSFREARPYAQYALEVFTNAGYPQYAAKARYFLQQIEQQMK
ncbi:MAG: hypothetical protein CV087_16040 [Candidatus Brocadia sp. WS118]|nr:MAG: hypothetical protein CV087_16040 [Candidatus Brocadia sp. WS118]